MTLTKFLPAQSKKPERKPEKREETVNLESEFVQRLKTKKALIEGSDDHSFLEILYMNGELISEEK
ncbi:MAG: hypothetical protein OEY30_01880 [Candidatus Bathyarchaeota archaeon]|nr:hypothetical protein [Candidatus Bathyarchaeota archaeon]